MEQIASNANFASLVAEGVAMVDFWATWCPPCRMLGSVVAAIAEERDDILVCKVNSDENQALCMKFGVSSIPALFLLKDGKVLDSSVGYRDKNALLRWIDSVI